MNWQSDEGTIHENCVVFFEVKGEFGGLSNMAGGYPLGIGGVTAYSSEALYQACRFPHRPEWQREIIEQRSPMAAKMKAKKDGRRTNHSRPDGGEVCVDLMRWVLRVKLAQHYDRWTALLRATAGRAIVERSRKDRVWGGVEESDGVLRGYNRLGRLLMQVRFLIEKAPREKLEVVQPLQIADFLLLGKPIGVVRASERPAD
ncbi:MAG TPA: NADAR family protein [Gemmataceae bacterium]|nr:NADAR family protein [Gemmataceae bacterium]